MIINLASLEDKARDVDPDLRFMALDDFQKYLNDASINKNSRNIERFIPRLYDLLADSATEVQNQAVKSFAPMMPYVGDEIKLQVIGHLYKLVVEVNHKERSDNYHKFTTSIPNMALRSIFNLEHPFSEKSAREALALILGHIFTDPISIDSVEILIDLFKNLGAHLTNDEVFEYLSTVLSVIQNTSGITSKRAVSAFDHLLTRFNAIEDEGVHANLTKLVVDKVCELDERYHVLQVVLANIKASGRALPEESFSRIYSVINDGLNTNDLEVDVEDFDLDGLISANVVRESALVTLAGLISAAPLLVGNVLDSIFDTVRIFIQYDPLQHDDDDAYDSDTSDIEFSDSDDDDNNALDDDNDGNASRLRLHTILVVRTLTTERFLLPVYQNVVDNLIVSIGDRNEQVSNEAIRTIIALVSVTGGRGARTRKRASSDVSMVESPSSILVGQVAPILRKELFSNLFTAKNTSRFLIFLKLLESLIQATPLTTDFVNQIFNKLVEFNLTSANNNEVLTLYRSILTNIDVGDISTPFLNGLIDDLAHSIDNRATYHNFIMESFAVINLLIEKTSHGHGDLAAPINAKLVHSITSKVLNKQYSLDLRQNALKSLSHILVHVKVDNLPSVVEVYKESLNYEVTATATIDNLIRILQAEGPNNNNLLEDKKFVAEVVGRVFQFVSSSDASVYLSSLILLERLPLEAGNVDRAALLANLLSILEETNDYKIVNLGLKVFRKLVDIEGAVDDATWVTFIDKVVDKLDDTELEWAALTQLVQSVNRHATFNVFDTTVAKLKPKLFVSSIILSVICVESHLDSFILQCEQDLTAYVQGGQLSTDKAIFNIQFLGKVSQHRPVLITLDDYYVLLGVGTDEIALATARAIGLFAQRDLEAYVPQLLSKYTGAEQSFLLVSFKQILESGAAITPGLLETIWESFNGVIATRNNLSTLELKALGDILSQIIKIDRQYHHKFVEILADTSADAEARIYANVVMIKALVGSYTGAEHTIISHLVEYSKVVSIDIKQGVISTILTGVHNRVPAFTSRLNQTIIPMIYSELEPKDEFKKTIPMGPYKYVIDEGLEVRKLSYELLYTIIGQHDTDDHVDFAAMFASIAARGLTDTENDIVSLACVNLGNLIERCGLAKVAKADVFAMLVENLTKQVNRKVRGKASTQEVESYEESIKSVIRLSKTINDELHRTNAQAALWNAYFSDMKYKHGPLFNSTE